MKYRNITVENTKSKLSFSNRVDNKVPWWRDLDLDGMPLYRIGNLCDTCQALFSQMETATLPLEPEALGKLLEAGIKDISDDVVETISEILPNGNYIAALLEVAPELIIDREIFYWKDSQPSFIPLQYLPKIKIYSPPSRPQKPERSVPLTDGQAPREYTYPLLKQQQLNEQTIAAYQDKISRGARPTALSLSVVDVRAPAGREFDWQLVHFLLDGHHKTMAASRMDQPITLLSFLTLTESFSIQTWIDLVKKYRYEQST